MVDIAHPDPKGSGHNSGGILEDLERAARERQADAQRAWHALMEAQIARNQSWAKILASAARTGVAMDSVRQRFNVSSSTFSRWLSGFASPSNALRSRLAADLVEMSRAAKDVVDPAGRQR